ncbi:MAG: four helix bundle protein [Flavobacteriaceae bacterium]|nr:four helix bundle protein [Flavobacteriaceae bacterium]
MDTIKKFEEMQVWKDSRKLTQSIYSLTRMRAFQTDFMLVKQMRTCVIETMNNIAEGFEKRSKRDFIQSLHISKCSLSELRSQIYIAYDQKYIDVDTFKEILIEVTQVSQQISGLIKYLNTYSKAELTAQLQTVTSRSGYLFY